MVFTAHHARECDARGWSLGLHLNERLWFSLLTMQENDAREVVTGIILKQKIMVFTANHARE